MADPTPTPAPHSTPRGTAISAGATPPPAPANTIVIATSRLKWFRLAAAANGVLVAALIAVLVYTVPRSLAYDRVLEENLVLKERLDDIDEKMSEVDRMLLRLRLYDSQLKSLADPRGDHGPVEGVETTLPDISGGEPITSDPAGGADGVQAPENGEGVSVDGLDAIDFANVGPGDVVIADEQMEAAEPGLRSAETWAEAIEDRADAFIASMERTEPNLTDLVVRLEDIRALKAALPNVWPARGDLTSGYGWRRNPVGHRGYRFHNGLDVANRRGTPLFAVSAGTVVRASWNSGYGRQVEIDHGYGITTSYAHCHRLLVKKGDVVKPGQRIATMGSTGRSTGPHLHFEVRLDGNAVDPMDYLPALTAKNGRR